jgi:hypothetical protein
MLGSEVPWVLITHDCNQENADRILKRKRNYNKKCYYYITLAINPYLHLLLCHIRHKRRNRI